VNDVHTANTFFLILTILAWIGIVVLAPAAIFAYRNRRLAGLANGLVEFVGPQARALAFVVAAMTTAGSLYYSLVAHFIPCELCWYQRIAMYPLAAILLVGLIRRDAAVRWYALPLIAIGAPLSMYHWLVERVPAFAETSSCSAVAPCTAPYFQELGFVSLAFMAFSSFLLIGTLLLMDRAYELGPIEDEPDAPELTAGDPDPEMEHV
jgi:disulfide bond formation protein DsbB